MIVLSNHITDIAVRKNVQHIVRLSSYGIDNHIFDVNCVSQGNLGEAHRLAELYMVSAGISFTSIRPTSFFSNFVKFDLQSINEASQFSSPLGNQAIVNWVACQDVGDICAWALMDTDFIGNQRIINVTGPQSNSLSSKAMVDLVSKLTNKKIEYRYVEAPPIDDLQQLWNFL